MRQLAEYEIAAVSGGNILLAAVVGFLVGTLIADQDEYRLRTGIAFAVLSAIWSSSGLDIPFED